jgi:ABC-type transport system involved in multi-copper enzyme maturation permease subunit
MINLIRLEFLKLRTTPGLYLTAGATLVLTLVSALSSILTKPGAGDDAIGSASQAHHVFQQAAAVSSMAMFILGVLIMAGEYRQRTILQTFLAEPRRVPVVLAKLVATGAVGAVLAGVSYVATMATALPLYASKNIHHLPIGLTGLGLGTVLSGACFGLLGVAVGALARNTVAAIVVGLIWIQVFEVAILQSAIPSMAKWLPVGASMGLTATGASKFLSQPAAAVTLVGWALVLVAVAAGVSTRRELR